MKSYKLLLYAVCSLLLSFALFVLAEDETIRIIAGVGILICLIVLALFMAKLLFREFIAEGWEDEEGFHFGVPAETQKILDELKKKPAAEKKGETIFTLRNHITMEKK